jgi:hypothetical protein
MCFSPTLSSSSTFSQSQEEDADPLVVCGMVALLRYSHISLKLLYVTDG